MFFLQSSQKAQREKEREREREMSVDQREKTQNIWNEMVASKVDETFGTSRSRAEKIFVKNNLYSCLLLPPLHRISSMFSPFQDCFYATFSINFTGTPYLFISPRSISLKYLHFLTTHLHLIIFKRQLSCYFLNSQLDY
jgi:hypothetical protein